jgi:hypothetical protein
MSRGDGITVLPLQGVDELLAVTLDLLKGVAVATDSTLGEFTVNVEVPTLHCISPFVCEANFTLAVGPRRIELPTSRL